MYELVYDISGSIFPFIKFPLFTLGMFVIFFLVYKGEEKISSKVGLIFAMIFISILFFSSLYWGISKKYRLSQVEPQVVEGEINKFIPMPYGGHAYESFVIDAVSFSYSDYAITGCFNETKSHGGAIEGNGQRVKIEYNKNCIMKLWVERK